MVDNNLLTDLSLSTIKIDRSNASFCEKNGFVALEIQLEENKKTYDRVFLHRMFPFELKWQYISVCDEESNEIGIIYDVSDLADGEIQLVKTELARKYYSPVIKKIKSVKERYGFSYWSVVVDEGRAVEFTVQDTFRNTLKVGEDKVIVLDVDGNRFVIENVLALDRKSYKEIELYL